MDNVKLVVRDLEMVFDDKQTLKKVNFEVRNGEFLSILGPSGCPLCQNEEETNFHIFVRCSFANYS